MQKYLLTVLLKDSLKDEERKELLTSVAKDFDNLIKEDLWGQRSLSYPIKHQDKAFYAHFEFEQEPSKVVGIDKKLKLNEDILRYLLVKIKDKKLDLKNRVKKSKIKEEIGEKEGIVKDQEGNAQIVA